MSTMPAYERDILDEFAAARAPRRYPEVDVALGMVVEDRASGFCGDVVKWSFEAVTLRDRGNHQRHFAWKPGGFLLEGRPVTLRRPPLRADRPATTTASGSVAGPAAPAKVAAASRIWVEGRHDAELELDREPCRSPDRRGDEEEDAGAGQRAPSPRPARDGPAAR